MKPSAEQLKRIQESTGITFKASDIEVYPAYMVDTEITSKSTILTEESIASLAAYINTNNIPVILAHEIDSSLPVGRVYNLSRGINEDTGKTVLYGEFYIPKNIAIPFEGSTISTNDIINSLSTGIISDVSISYSCEINTCSICGKGYYKDCQHLQGKSYKVANGCGPKEENSYIDKVDYACGDEEENSTHDSDCDCGECKDTVCAVIGSGKAKFYEVSLVYSGASSKAVITALSNAKAVEGEVKNQAEVNKVVSHKALTLSRMEEGNNMDKENIELSIESGVDEAVELSTSSEKVEAIVEEVVELATEDTVVELAAKDSVVEGAKVVENVTLKLLESKVTSLTEENIKLSKDLNTLKNNEIENIITLGVRLAGNAFPVDHMRKAYKSMDIDTLLSIKDELNSSVNASIPAGKQTVTEDLSTKLTNIPNINTPEASELIDAEANKLLKERTELSYTEAVSIVVNKLYMEGV
jgi:hypothetical protein